MPILFDNTTNGYDHMPLNTHRPDEGRRVKGEGEMPTEDNRHGAKQFVDVVFDRPWVHWYNVAVTILAWLAIVFVGFWFLDHIARTLIVLVTASLLAYALAPAVKQLSKFLPRYLAIGIIYILVFGGVGVFAV